MSKVFQICLLKSKHCSREMRLTKLLPGHLTVLESSDIKISGIKSLFLTGQFRTLITKPLVNTIFICKPHLLYYFTDFNIVKLQGKQC